MLTITDELLNFYYILQLSITTCVAMIKHIYFCTLGFLLLFACSSDEEELLISRSVSNPDLISSATIDHTVRRTLEKQQAFAWHMVSDQTLWSALLRSDSILFVGYQPAGDRDVNEQWPQLDLNAPAWQQAKTELLIEIAQRLPQQATVVSENPKLPYVAIKTASYDLVRHLRTSPRVRYVEPSSYTLQTTEATHQRTAAKITCDYEDQSVLPQDFQTVDPNARVSWNFASAQITQAWQRSTGAGVTIGLIDTGVNPDQIKLNDQFNDGFSQGRSITALGSYNGDGAADQCGHGTRMAGVIAAPRGTTGSAVGVAYNASLISYRGTSDVIVNERAEKDGVVAALTALADRSDVRVISMSIGDLFDSGPVADAIRYAYGRDKLICAAAGTSTSFTNWAGVVFPARMEETVAITGTRENEYRRCNNCHSGSRVDFVLAMQRQEDTERTTLTLRETGDEPTYIGGSSIATAMTAGVAALVWSQNPTWTRDQVLQRLKESAEFYPNRDATFGWGLLNAAEAVGASPPIAQN